MYTGYRSHPFQATVYLKTDNHPELVITVNITCMMVLTSVYLSVSSSLPRTPSIKPVEIWLLGNLAYPFFIIIASIIHHVSIHQSNYFTIKCKSNSVFRTFLMQKIQQDVFPRKYVQQLKQEKLRIM